MSSAQNRQARLLEEVLKVPGNNMCADCRAMAPRWASINLGIFICVQCASVHRKLGTHLSRVKSCTMDSWTREQVDGMRQLGNEHQNAIYNPDTSRHPPPTSTAEFNDRDSELEKFIRKKWVQKAFMAPQASSSGSSTGGGAQTASPGRPRASTTAAGSGGGGTTNGMEQRNSRHTELNDIVVPIARGREFLPPLPPSRSPVFNGSGMLKDDRTGSSAGSTEPRRRPSPSGGMGSYTSAGGFVGNGSTSGTRKTVATKNHVESNWADLLGMEGPPPLGPTAPMARSAPPTPRRVTSPNPSPNMQAMQSAHTGSTQQSYTSAMSNIPSTAFLSPNSVSGGSTFAPSAGHSSGGGSMAGSPFASQVGSFVQQGMSPALSTTMQMQGQGQGQGQGQPSPYGSPYNPFNGQQGFSPNMSMQQYPMQQTQHMQSPHPFPLAQQPQQQQYIQPQQSPFPLAQTPTSFVGQTQNGSYFQAAGQVTPMSLGAQGQNGNVGYFGQGQVQVQGTNQFQTQGFGGNSNGGYGHAMGGAASQQQQQQGQSTQQQPGQQSQPGNGFGLTNTQYSGMMMPAGWGGRS